RAFAGNGNTADHDDLAVGLNHHVTGQIGVVAKRYNVESVSAEGGIQRPVGIDARHAPIAVAKLRVRKSHHDDFAVGLQRQVGRAVCIGAEIVKCVAATAEGIVQTAVGIESHQ